MAYHSRVTANPEDREQYRQHIAGLDLSIQERDTLIDIVGTVLGYFVDQAFNVTTDQITLQSVDKHTFKAQIDHVTISNRPEKPTADAQSDGVESDSNPIGPSKP